MTAASGSFPAPEAVKVLVSSLADESPIVREASLSALKEIAPLNPLIVLDCCCTVSCGTRRRFVNMAGVFSVMACAAWALDMRDVDPALMTKLATSEIVTSKDLNSILCTLLPVAFINNNNDKHLDFPKRLKAYNEIHHCFLVIGSVYPEDLYAFLLSKCQLKDELFVVGALCVIKHLLPRLLEAWHAKRNLLV